MCERSKQIIPGLLRRINGQELEIDKLRKRCETLQNEVVIMKNIVEENEIIWSHLWRNWKLELMKPLCSA